MKIAQLFHNPGAGGEEFDDKAIQTMLATEGFECRYSSTKKKGWKELDDDTDFIVIAGGDGTVRKVTGVLLDRPQFEKIFPIGLLPMGTANNIAKTLDLQIDLPDIIKSWHLQNYKPFDVGLIKHKELEQRFFLESIGFGIFPYLMIEMKKKKKEEGEESDPAKKLQSALDTLLEIIDSYEPRKCKLEIDGEDYSGKYILAEVMNTKSIGPNLSLAPNSDPGDGIFDVVVVSEEDKDKFEQYVSELSKGIEAEYEFTRIPGKKITISWDGTHVHVDDEIVKIEKKTEVDIEMNEGLLKFLIVDPA